jgi:hypothetical protein
MLAIIEPAFNESWLFPDRPTSLKYIGSQVPGLTQSESHVSVEVVNMQLDLNVLFHFAIHVACHSSQKCSILEADTMPCPALCYVQHHKLVQYHINAC